MQRFISFVTKPYREKGFILGTLDTLVKAFTLAVWGYLVYILGLLLLESILNDFNPLHKMWWFSYCFSMLFGGTWLACIVFFVRDYNEE